MRIMYNCSLSDIKEHIIDDKLNKREKWDLLCHLERLEHLEDIIDKTTNCLYKQFEEKSCKNCGFAMKCVDGDGNKNSEYDKCFKYYAEHNCSDAELILLKMQFGWSY